MNVPVIFENIKKMLDYRLNAKRIKFNIVFSEFDGDSGDATEKTEYKYNTNNNGTYDAVYTYNNKIYKKAYLNPSINEIKNYTNNEDIIVLYPSNDRKIKKIIKSGEFKCEFFESNLFLSDYRSNIYFTYICKSDEKNLANSNLQYISTRDFSIMYCGLKEGDIALAISIVDPTLILPQLRIVKTINESEDDT